MEVNNLYFDEMTKSLKWCCLEQWF